MRIRISARLSETLFDTLAALLLTCGLALPILHSLGMRADAAFLRAALVTAALCGLWRWGGRLRFAALGAGLVLLAATLLTDGRLARVGGMLGSLVHLFSGNAEPLKAYAAEGALCLGILVTLFSAFIASPPAGAYPAGALLLLSVFAIWFTGHTDALPLLLPALCALLMLLSRDSDGHTSRPLVVVSAALVVGLAFAASGTLTFRSARLERLAETYRTLIQDTLFFTDPRTVYSLQADGYQPHENRLGGPANPLDRPVLTVETPRTVLLRGSVKNNYNGLLWADTLASRRYRYADVRNRAVRADVLDEERPADALRESDLFAETELKIYVQSGSASTLFVPQRLTGFDAPLSIVPYFNASSELFATRDLSAGDVYEVSAPLIDANDARLPALLRLCAEGAEAVDRSAYLGVPEYIAESVRTLTAKLVQNCNTPYERAVAIQTYLAHNFTYTLTPADPPANQDFVSYFLLVGKEGYCTYFASAMAVMGRIAGLPTRYVEGYLARPSGGVALVTSKEAHAWAEVWFDGFGWLAFDATPAQGTGGNDTPDPQGGGAPENGGEDETETPAPSPTPQDSGGSAQEPTPSPAPQDEPSPEPEDTPEEEPSPSPSPEPDSAPDSEPPEARSSGAGGSGPWLLWLLIVLLLTAAVVWRVRATLPALVAARQKDATGRFFTWYRAILGALAASGMPAKPMESPTAYARRVTEAMPGIGLTEAADAAAAAGYGRHGASAADVETAKRCYEAVTKALALPARLRWALRRTVLGIGNPSRIP